MNNTELLNQLLQDTEKVFKQYNYQKVPLFEHINSQVKLNDIIKVILKHYDHPGLSAFPANPTLEKEIHINRLALEAIQTDLNKLVYLNQEILKQESELSQQKKAMQDKQTQIQTLKTLKAELDSFQQTQPDIVIRQLQEQTEKKEREIFSYLEKLKLALEGASTQMQTQVKKLAGVVANDVRDFDNFNAEQLGSLKDSNLKIHSQFTNLDKIYNALWQDYTTCYEKILDIKKELEGVKDVYEKNMQVFNEHFSDNKQVWGSLESRGSMSAYIQDLIDKVSGQLKAFDKELKKIIEERDSIPVHQFKHSK